MDTPINLDAYAQEVTLEDGRKVLLRPIRSEDAPLLQEGFRRLSQESIYMRFLNTAVDLSDEAALELAMVDYRERMALVGEVQEAGKPHLVAVARYSLIPGRSPATAETGIVVRDDYQGVGLGKLAMEAMIRYAQECGIAALYGTIHTNNQRIVSFIRKSGFEFDRHMLEPGVWEYTIFLERPAAGEGGGETGA